MGRTARGATGSGRGLLFLIPEELGFLKYLRASGTSSHRPQPPPFLQTVCCLLRPARSPHTAPTPAQRPQAAKVPLNEYEFPQSKLANVQGQLEKLVAKNYYLHTSAREAYRSYILAYNSHQLKEARGDALRLLCDARPV